MVNFVSELMARYPKVDVDLNVSDRAVNLIEEGYEADFRIGPPGIGDSSLVGRPLRPYQMAACATPEYLSRSAPRHPKDLRQHQCLGDVFWDKALYEWEFTQGADRYSVKVTGRLKINDANAFNAALNHEEILLAAQEMVSLASTAANLFKCFPLTEALGKRPIWCTPQTDNEP